MTSSPARRFAKTAGSGTGAAATGGDGLNKFGPAARETLRMCADALRMMVDHGAQEAPTAVVQPVKFPKRPKCFEFAMDFLGAPEDSEMRRYVEALEAIAVQPSQDPEPGWKLVPVEPTQGMIDAAAQTTGIKAIDAAATLHQLRGYPLGAFSDGASPLQQAYRAMLNAAPPAPTTGDTE